MNKKGSDNFQTPPIALNCLLKFIPKNFVVWECACGKGNLAKNLREREFTVVDSDILDGRDFLTWQPDKFDCIITNPPYSIKQHFLERCYNLGKPFALLLPLAALETQKRQNEWKKGLQLIILDKVLMVLML